MGSDVLAQKVEPTNEFAFVLPTKKEIELNGSYFLKNRETCDPPNMPLSTRGNILSPSRAKAPTLQGQPGTIRTACPLPPESPPDHCHI